MSGKPEPIDSHYGTQFEVDCAFKSAGPAVYLERNWQVEDPKAPGTYIDADSFDRFTPEQARELASRLNKAADEVEPPHPAAVKADP